MASLFTLLFLLVSPSLGARGPRIAPPPVEPPIAPLTAPELALVAGVKATQPADFLFLLDTAGTLLDEAKAARVDIAHIVENLPVGDSVEITAYHIRPTVALERTTIAEATRPALVERIKTLELGSSNDSDLGRGLAHIVGRLSGENAARVAFVVMLGTFCHSPSLESDFDSGGRGCRWIRGVDKLNAAFETARSNQVLSATLIRTGPAQSIPGEETGIEGALTAMDTMFGDTRRVVTSQTSFHAWAREFAGRMPIERIAPLIRQDARSAALTVRLIEPPTAARPTATIEITGGTRHVSMKLTGLRVEGAATPDFPAELDLTPSARMEIPLKLPSAGLALIPRTETTELKFSLHADGVLLPADGLQALGINPNRPGLTVSSSAPYIWSTGYLGLAILLGGFLFVSGAALATFQVVRGRMQRLRLGGSFSYRKDGGPRKALDIADLPEAFIGISESGELLAGKGRGAVLALRVVRDRGQNYTEVEIFADGVEMNRKPARRGRQRVTAGATSFTFGGYRLSWE